MTCNGRTGRSRCDGRILDADGERTAAYRLDYPLHSKSLGVGICDLARPAATSSYSRRGSHNPPVVGSSPTRPTCDLIQRPGQTVNLGRERAAQIEFGKLLAQAVAGRQPDSAVTVAQLLDQYASTARWDVSIRESNLGYIRRTIKPAIGSTRVRKVRGPLLDTE